MAERRAALVQIVQAQQPMTVRQVFYQATVKGLVEKTELGYAKVQTDLANMREDGTLPFSWITDSTRIQRKYPSYSSIVELLEDSASLYRRHLWRDLPCYVELWLEKDALSGVVFPITSMYDVPLMVARGFASKAFLYASAESIKANDKPAYIYHLGDADPSGVSAAKSIHSTLCRYAPQAEIHFERLAVLPWQIERWNLPTRPNKAGDPRTKNFDSDVSVELDAIPPDILRGLVSGAIERHMPQEQLHILQVAEQSERETLHRLAQHMAGYELN
jgi:hypothetical protein